MKLEELLEVNFPGGKGEQIDVREPSGVSSPTTVDPEDVRDMLHKDKDKSKKMRRHWKVAKKMREPGRGGGVRGMGDSEDMTSSGPHSAVNGPHNY